MPGMRYGHSSRTDRGGTVPVQMAALPVLSGRIGDRCIHRNILSECVFLLPVHPDRVLRLGPLKTAGVHPDGDIVRRRDRAGVRVDILVLGTVLISS